MDALLDSLPGIIILLGVGTLLVIKGGEWFVEASVAIAYYAKIPKVVIGSTLVSVATTAPELSVSATASLLGRPGLAIGNAVGSAIVNIGIILGILCILRPMNVRARDFRVPAFTMLAAGVLMVGLTWGLNLSRAGGILLLACGAAYLAFDYLRHRPRRGAEPAAADLADRPSHSLRRSIGVFLLGAVVVVLGSKVMADSAVKLATRVGVPPMIIGLTLVAFGTSLPELVTALTAARKGVPELSLGNILGANIMNITLVTGTAATIRPLRMTRLTQAYNFPAMVAIFVLLLILARTGRRLTRKEGFVLIAFYALYLGGLILIRE